MELRKLDLSVLVDMLANYTAEYTKMMKDGVVGEGFSNCEALIHELLSEIDFRQQLETEIASEQHDLVRQPPDQ
jgi:hypothetical protein